MQKGVLVMMDEKFLAEIDAVYSALGFSDRASFIRASVISYLAGKNIHLPKSYQAAPPRVGKSKGGRPRKAALKPVESDEPKRKKA